MINEQLTKLEFNGRTFYYIIKSRHTEWGTSYFTYFFLTNDKIRFSNKYLGLFGPLVAIPNNDFAFKLDINIESCYYTKNEIRRKLITQIEILDRCEQIKNGEIV